MEWHELGDGAESKPGRRSQRIVCGGCDTERNSLGCGNSLSLPAAADAGRAKAALTAELRLTRSRQIHMVVSFSPLSTPFAVCQSAIENLKSQMSLFP